MFNRKVLKHVACIVVVAYMSVLGAGSVSAGQTSHNEMPLLLAQVLNPASTSTTKAEEESALRGVYLDKIQRLEASMNSKRGSRNTLLTATIASVLIGAGIIAGSGSVEDSVNKIPTDDPVTKDSVDQAVEALNVAKGVGTGFVVLGGITLLGYFIYSAAIGGNQRQIDELRAELDVKFDVAGLSPEYLQMNESVAAVQEEIEATKKSAASSQTWKSVFYRIAVGTLLSGGFLFGLSGATNTVVDEITINESDPTQVTAKDDAVKAAESLATTGAVLVGTGVVSWLIGFFFGRSAKSKENKIEELEDSLLRVAEGIDVHPTHDGFMVMYSYQF